MNKYARFLVKDGENFTCAFYNEGKCTIHKEKECKKGLLCNEMLYSICWKLYELEQILEDNE